MRAQRIRRRSLRWGGVRHPSARSWEEGRGVRGVRGRLSPLPPLALALLLCVACHAATPPMAGPPAGPDGGAVLQGTVTGPGEAPPHIPSTPHPSLRPRPVLQTNEAFIRSLHTNLDITDTREVFYFVLSSLPPQVDVIPTENYYYFSFYTAGREVRGNIRFDVYDRDEGRVSFVYYVHRPHGEPWRESATWQAALGAEQGVYVLKVSDNVYAVSMRGKTVRFHLNPAPRTPPAVARLAEGDELMGRAVDESGIAFLLVYDTRRKAFIWLLDEERPTPPLERIAEGMLLDPLSGFIFWDDRQRRAKVLIGVSARDVRLNTYWDGPFDQLPDNNPHPRLKERLEEAHPYARGRLDALGRFTDEKRMRMAVTPYYEYETLDEMADLVEDCRRREPAYIVDCLTYDWKSSLEP